LIKLDDPTSCQRFKLNQLLVLQAIVAIGLSDWFRGLYTSGSLLG